MWTLKKLWPWFANQGISNVRDDGWAWRMGRGRAPARGREPDDQGKLEDGQGGGGGLDQGADSPQGEEQK